MAIILAILGMIGSVDLSAFDRVIPQSQPSDIIYGLQGRSVVRHQAGKTKLLKLEHEPEYRYQQSGNHLIQIDPKTGLVTVVETSGKTFELVVNDMRVDFAEWHEGLLYIGAVLAIQNNHSDAG